MDDAGRSGVNAAQRADTTGPSWTPEVIGGGTAGPHPDATSYYGLDGRTDPYGPDVHQVVNAVESFRWLLSELGARGLSGMLKRGDLPVHTAMLDEDGYVPPVDDQDHNGPATIRAVTPDTIGARLALNYLIWHWSGKGDDKTRKQRFFPTDSIRNALEALDKAVNLRRLRGITHTPMVRADGTILAHPGFDDDSGFLYLPTVDVPAVPDNPTSDQTTAAVALLRGLVDEFAWAGKHDEANFLGLLLTPLLRELCPPPYKLGAIMARQPGSGKSLLNRILRDVHGGVFRSEMPHDDAELAKVITSILNCTTAPVVQFDNVSGTLRSSRLAGLLTSAVYSDRVLGSTNNIDMVNDRCWTVTGNNLNFGGDLIRRTLWVTIDPHVPAPHLRTGFRLDIPTYVAQRRGDILHALLTLVRRWICVGSPTLTLSSDDYGRWSSVVRGILRIAGIPGEFDHADSAQQTVGADDEGWGEFLVEVRAAMGDGTWSVRDLVDRMSGSLHHGGEDSARPLVDALPSELHERYLRAHESAPAIARSLGMWLRNRNGRWAAGHVVEDAGRDALRNTALWRVNTYGESL